MKDEIERISAKLRENERRASEEKDRLLSQHAQERGDLEQDKADEVEALLKKMSDDQARAAARLKVGILDLSHVLGSREESGGREANAPIRNGRPSNNLNPGLQLFVFCSYFSHPFS